MLLESLQHQRYHNVWFCIDQFSSRVITAELCISLKMAFTGRILLFLTIVLCLDAIRGLPGRSLDRAFYRELQQLLEQKGEMDENLVCNFRDILLHFRLKNILWLNQYQGTTKIINYLLLNYNTANLANNYFSYYFFFAKHVAYFGGQRSFLFVQDFQ